MTWWCSARSTAWTWSWQPYPGVWLFVLLLVVAYVALLRWARPPNAIDPDRPRPVSYGLGVLAVWIAADWPVGPLGAGYLVSVHTAQYLTFTMLAPPLLLRGVPTWALRRVLLAAPVARVTRVLTRPLIAFAIFNAVLLATHLPAAVDRLTVSQAGSFLMDMAWLGAGLLFWWQVLGPLPELEPLTLPGRIVFLLLNVFIPTVPAAFLTFADYPIYALYELAPRASGLSANDDQQLAGLIMKIAGGFIIFGTASVLFFRWYGLEARDEGRI